MMKNWLAALGFGGGGRALPPPRGGWGGVVDAVSGKLALDVPARAAGAGAQRAAALDHKAGDDTVEGQAVIKALLDQLLKFSQVMGATSSFSSMSMMPPSSIVMRTITLQYSFLC